MTRRDHPEGVPIVFAGVAESFALVSVRVHYVADEHDRPTIQRVVLPLSGVNVVDHLMPGELDNLRNQVRHEIKKARESFLDERLPPGGDDDS